MCTILLRMKSSPPGFGWNLGRSDGPVTAKKKAMDGLPMALVSVIVEVQTPSPRRWAEISNAVAAAAALIARAAGAALALLMWPVWVMVCSVGVVLGITGEKRCQRQILPKPGDSPHAQST
jgi:hypothetical protein